MTTVHCPRCDDDISDTYEGPDPDVGIMSGCYYCDACNYGIADHEVEREPMADDVPISFAEPGRPLGTPFSELASQPGTTAEQQAKHENFKRIARSWGYD